MTSPAPGAVVLGVGLLVLSTLAFFRVPLLPEVGAELRLTAAQLGGITAAFAVGRLLVDLPAGALADRVPAARLYAAASALMCVGSVFAATAQSAGAAWLGAGLVGAASAIANTTAMVVFARAASRGTRGRTMAVFSSGLLVGQTAGPAVAGVLAAAAGWRPAQAFAAVVAALSAVAFALVAVRRPPWAGLVTSPPATVEPAPLPRRPHRRMRRRRGGEEDAPFGARGSRSGALGRAPIGPPPVLVTLYAVAFATFFTLAAVAQTLVPLIGAGELGLGPAAIGLALGLGGLCRIAGAWVGGSVADRTGRRAALIPGLTLMAVGTGVLGLADGLAGWWAAIMLTSLGTIGIGLSATIIADLSEGGRSGARLGRYRFVGDLGLLIGPALAGALYGSAGRQLPLLINAGLLAACALAVLLVVPETLRSSAAPSPGSAPR